MNEIHDIRNWQVSLSNSAAIVEGTDDIAQCIYTILATIPGTDPLRPTFGSNICLYIDRPMNEVAPRIIYEAVKAIGKWEKRIKVTKCTVTSTVGAVDLHITGTVIHSAEQITIDVKI